MHECSCKNGTRRLALLHPSLVDEESELADAAVSFDASLNPELGIAILEVGPDDAFPGIAAVADFVRAVVDPETFEAVRAAWVSASRSISDQLSDLLHAKPLASLAPIARTNILSILNERRISTWFQPIVDRDLEVWGYECLMRGQGADGELIGAGELIGWAIDENLTFLMDRVCRETHIENAAKVSELVPAHAKFLINFLPSVIYRPKFCLRSTFDAVSRTSLDPGRIVFEVVESEEVEDRAHLTEILASYREAGFGVALDDVGTGHAGLTLLADLDPDLIKVDRTLANSVDHSVTHRNVCEAIVTLGHRSDKLVLAEGVETPEAFEVLHDLGFDLFQGYLFARPAPEPATSVSYP